jgi:hypothetical protein
VSAVLEQQTPTQPPPAWNDRMLLAYPNGATVRFDPCGRFYRPGDLLNGCVVDRFELDGDVVVAILTAH